VHTTTPISGIRSDFPALERVHNLHPVAYFDGPGGTQVPRAVTDSMVDYLHNHNANTHWPYPSSVETDVAVAHARSVFAAFFNCESNEVVFGANMTTLTMHVSRALARSFPGGAEIVVTELDHHANIDPWRELEKDYDVVVRTAPMIPETGQLDWAALQHLITNKTALVAIGAASNAIGTISNVKRAAGLAHAVGALVYVDGVHYAPHRLPDVRAWDADFFVCSPYKFYGPHLGVLYGKRDLLDRLDPPRLLPAVQESPERFETGTLSHEGIVGAAAAVEWLAHLSAVDKPLRERLTAAYREIRGRGEGLFRRLWSGLDKIEEVAVYGPPPGEPRTDTVGFTVAGHHSEDVARALAELGVFTCSGDFYAQTVVQRLGLQEDGLVRAGCAAYTTASEVDRLVMGVTEIVKRPGS
jgi:cysteine desulfurase family protein (TIGR01976 family)